MVVARVLVVAVCLHFMMGTVEAYPTGSGQELELIQLETSPIVDDAPTEQNEQPETVANLEKKLKHADHEVAKDKASKEKDLEMYAALHKRITKISRGAITCDEVVSKLHAEVKVLRGKVAKTSKATKSTIVEGYVQKVNSLKKQREEDLNEQSRLQGELEKAQSMIQMLRERVDGLKGDGAQLSKGLQVVQGQDANLKDKMEQMAEAHEATKKQLQKAVEKGQMLDQCQSDKAKVKDQVKAEYEEMTLKLKQAVAKAETKASISKRGYQLCQGQLASANAAGESLKAAAMKQEADAAAQAAKQSRMEKTMRKRITAEVSEKIRTEEQDKYDAKLARAIQQVAKTTPISPKCQACAKLSSQEKIDTGASCGDCN